jgi:hypothetical protein
MTVWDSLGLVPIAEAIDLMQMRTAAKRQNVRFADADTSTLLCMSMDSYGVDPVFCCSF